MECLLGLEAVHGSAAAGLFDEEIRSRPGNDTRVSRDESCV